MNEPITLATLGDGAAEELFQDKVRAVLGNIADPNTDHKAVRKIVLEVTVKANEERDIADVMIKASAKLAGLKPHGTRVYMGRHPQTGKLVAVENNPKQPSLFDAPAVAGPQGIVAQNGANK